MGQFVRILIARRGHIQLLVVGNRVVMVVVFDKLNIVIMAVMCMAQTQTGNKLMRFGYSLYRLNIAITLHKGKLLPATIQPLCFNQYLIFHPDMAAFAVQPETWRHTILKHFQPHYAVPSVDMFGIIMTMLKYPFMSAEEKDNMHIKEGKENLNIRTVMAHINGDLVYSVGVLLGAIAININQDWKILVPLLTVLFSFVVLHITVPVFTDSMSAVMEASPSEEEYNEIATAITSTPGVKKVYSLRVWSLTQDQRCAAVHLSLEEGQEEQKLQHEIGKRLQEKDISFWAIQVWKPSWKYQC